MVNRNALQLSGMMIECDGIYDMELQKKYVRASGGRWWLASSTIAAFMMIAPPTLADEFALQVYVGQCEYSFNPAKDLKFTKCSSDALIFNTSTSETFSCRASVEGDQYTAPSVVETVPEAVVCTRIGQPFDGKSGPYDLSIVDDTAKADKTLNRLQGAFTWKTGFWTLSRGSFDIKFCAVRVRGAGVDYRINCSKRIEWIR